jgi:hypothetical protein
MSLNLGIIASSRASAPAVSLLLDTYPGAAAAYSLRKLRSAYTGNCIRVQRVSDLVEQDIGFVNNVLDTATLLTFAGASNCVVRTWFDQSGNSRNATSGLTTANYIVIGGVLQTINSKSAISILNLQITSSFTVIDDVSYFMVQNKLSSNSGGINTGSAPGLGLLFSNWNDGNLYFQRSNGTSGFIIGAADTTTGVQVLNAFNNAGAMSMYKNNNIYTLNLNTTFVLADSQIGSIGTASGSGSNGLGAELIIYTNSQLSNRTGINSNINTYYSIY